MCFDQFAAYEYRGGRAGAAQDHRFYETTQHFYIGGTFLPVLLWGFCGLGVDGRDDR